MLATEQASLCGRGPSFYGDILLCFELPHLLLPVMAIVDWVIIYLPHISCLGIVPKVVPFRRSRDVCNSWAARCSEIEGPPNSTYSFTTVYLHF